MESWYFKARLSWDAAFEDLDNEEVGRLMKAIWHYASTGEIVKPEGAEKIAFSIFVKDLIEDDKERAELSEKRKICGSLGGRPKKATESKEKQEEPNESKKTNWFSEKPNENKDNQENHSNSNSNSYSNSKSNSQNNIVGGEKSKDSSPQAVIFLILNDHSMYAVTQEDIDHYSELYPAVDVLAELRKMCGWLESKPANRKTRTGIKSFITRWLGKAQDQAAAKPAPKKILEHQYSQRNNTDEIATADEIVAQWRKTHGA